MLYANSKMVVIFDSFLFGKIELVWGYILLLHLIDIEVVVYEGIIREKPSSKEEARQFIKGLLNGFSYYLFSIAWVSYVRSCTHNCRLFWWSCCSGGICVSNQPSYGYQKRRMGQGGGSVFSSIFCTLGEWWLLIRLEHK